MKTRNQISFLIAALFMACSISAFSQDKDQFKSDVETKLKPWTNLEFYNDPSNFQFALVSDNTGSSRQGIFDLAVKKLNMMMPEFVLSVGDLIQGYTEDTSSIKVQWDDFNQKVDKLNMPFFYLPGNHDITNLVMQKEWEKRYGRRYYQFTYKGVLFIILDSNDDDDHNLTEAQTSFALNALKENPDARWTFVLMHHPIWKYDTGGRFEKIEEALSNRKHTVIAGHEHHYQYIERNESNYYVLATTGGGSGLIGNRFGSFDHIVWMTMTDNGPVMANL
ncbi:MAG: metallophosphoesterase, partial [Cyclobacteriaceae bacterium]|nr:metallophosphoesterase [Cyclobacteriaceae bacterium]